MKTLHLSIIAGVGISIATTVLILTLNMQSITDTNTHEVSKDNTLNSDCTPAYPSSAVPITAWLAGGQVTTLQDVSQLTGEPIKIPKYLPTGYSIKLVGVTKELAGSMQRITIFASKFPINSSLTTLDFIYRDRGLDWVYDKVPLDQEANEIKQPQNQPEWKLLEINGRKALGHEIIRADPKPHGCMEAELIFYIGNNTRINISGLFPLSELAKIATSF